mmetsp:Transcript_74239/g.210188  ORF Transcript_74239/g.210188 Transcript_74239/m.210188 type:complete len:330 (+) Transcript_74239:378-1367(+)
MSRGGVRHHRRELHGQGGADHRLLVSPERQLRDRGCTHQLRRPDRQDQPFADHRLHLRGARLLLLEQGLCPRPVQQRAPDRRLWWHHYHPRVRGVFWPLRVQGAGAAEPCRAQRELLQLGSLFARRHRLPLALLAQLRCRGPRRPLPADPGAHQHRPRAAGLDDGELRPDAAADERAHRDRAHPERHPGRWRIHRGDGEPRRPVRSRGRRRPRRVALNVGLRQGPLPGRRGHLRHQQPPRHARPVWGACVHRSAALLCGHGGEHAESGDRPSRHSGGRLCHWRSHGVHPEEDGHARGALHGHVLLGVRRGHFQGRLTLLSPHQIRQLQR